MNSLIKKENRNKIRPIFQRRIQTPWVLAVLLVTLFLTGLFYYSQNQQILVYSGYADTLSDYKYQEMRLRHSMARQRENGSQDSASIISQTMVLREMAVSLSSSAEQLASQGDWMPPISLFILFEKKVLTNVSDVKRYLNLRRRWISELNSFYQKINGKTPGVNRDLWNDLEKMRLGETVPLRDFSGLNPELAEELKHIYFMNAETATLWIKIDNDETLLICDTLLQYFKLRQLEELSFKFKIQLVFYILSIFLLLATVFFAFYSRQSPDKA